MSSAKSSSTVSLPSLSVDRAETALSTKIQKSLDIIENSGIEYWDVAEVGRSDGHDSSGRGEQTRVLWSAAT